LEPEPTIEQFYIYCSEKKLMGVRCKDCGSIQVPPRALCTLCFSSNMEWQRLSGLGKVLTFTEVQSAGYSNFQEIVPYTVGIVQLDEGPQLSGIIKHSESIKEIYVGADVSIEFETEPSAYWPNWPRYYFTIIHQSNDV